MLKFITAVAALFVVQLVCAQDVLLKGTVRDSITNEPLIGVNVVYAPGKGTVTAVDGAYALRLPIGPQTITYTFVGYQPLTVRLDLPMANSVTNDVRLKVSVNQLDMVVISAGWISTCRISLSLVLAVPGR